MGNNHSGSRRLQALAVVLIIGLFGGAGYLWHRAQQPTKTTSNLTSKTDKQTTTNPYVSWQTYSDASSPATGLTIQYPKNWAVQSNSKTYAWTITNLADPTQLIAARSVFLSSTTTPEQEWTACPSADACGPAPGDKTITSGDLTINDLAAYQVKAQNSSGTYYATVLKGKSSDDSNTAFVELITFNPNPTTLAIYQAVVRSAQFK